MQYVFNKLKTIFLLSSVALSSGNCITSIHKGYELNYNPKIVAKQVPKVKEVLVYIEKITELDEFSDFDQAQPIGSSRDSTAFIPPQNQEYFKRMIISEIVKCRCVETVHVLIKDGETIDEIRKQYSNVISTKIRYHYNPGRTFLAYFITSISLFLIPTWNSVYVSNEFEIYSPKSKVPEKMKIEYAETTYRHLVFLPWLFTDENSQYSFYTHRIPGAYRNAMEEAYNKGIFLIEK